MIVRIHQFADKSAHVVALVKGGIADIPGGHTDEFGPQGDHKAVRNVPVQIVRSGHAGQQGLVGGVMHAQIQDILIGLDLRRLVV